MQINPLLVTLHKQQRSLILNKLFIYKLDPAINISQAILISPQRWQSLLTSKSLKVHNKLFHREYPIYATINTFQLLAPCELRKMSLVIWKKLSFFYFFRFDRFFNHCKQLKIFKFIIPISNFLLSNFYSS